MLNLNLSHTFDSHERGVKGQCLLSGTYRDTRSNFGESAWRRVEGDNLAGDGESQAAPTRMQPRVSSLELAGTAAPISQCRLLVHGGSVYKRAE